jgi:hypothetical protein
MEVMTSPRWFDDGQAEGLFGEEFNPVGRQHVEQDSLRGFWQQEASLGLAINHVASPRTFWTGRRAFAAVRKIASFLSAAKTIRPGCGRSATPHKSLGDRQLETHPGLVVRDNRYLGSDIGAECVTWRPNPIPMSWPQDLLS